VTILLDIHLTAQYPTITELMAKEARDSAAADPDIIVTIPTGLGCRDAVVAVFISPIVMAHRAWPSR
jgi:hypothetical protein